MIGINIENFITVFLIGALSFIAYHFAAPKLGLPQVV